MPNHTSVPRSDFSLRPTQNRGVRRDLLSPDSGDDRDPLCPLTGHEINLTHRKYTIHDYNQVGDCYQYPLSYNSRCRGIGSHADDELLNQEQALTDSNVAYDEALARPITWVTRTCDVVSIDNSLCVSEKMTLLEIARKRNHLSSGEIIAIVLGRCRKPELTAISEVLKCVATRQRQ